MKTVIVCVGWFVVMGLMYFFLRRHIRGRRQEEHAIADAFASKLGLEVVAESNMSGVPMPPAIHGVHRGRPIAIRSGMDRRAELDRHAEPFRALSGSMQRRLYGGYEGEFTWLEVTCANPSGAAFYVVRNAPIQGETALDGTLTAKVGPGSEWLWDALRSEPLRQDLAQAGPNLMTFALLGKSAIYVEKGRFIHPSQAVRFARMLDVLAGVGDAVASPRA